MTSFPHNLVFDSQPRFGLTPSACLNLYNFLINQRFFMKLVAKCSPSVSLSDQVHVKVCNPIPLKFPPFQTPPLIIGAISVSDFPPYVKR